MYYTTTSYLLNILATNTTIFLPPYIPTAEAGGFTAVLDKVNVRPAFSLLISQDRSLINRIKLLNHYAKANAANA